MTLKDLRIPRLLAEAPVFADADRTLLARQVFLIVRAFILSSALLQLALIALHPRITAYWLAMLLGSVAVGVVLLRLNRNGRARLAATLMVASLWLLIVLFAWTRAGLGIRAVYGFFIVVFIAGMSLGKWQASLTALACSASTLLIALKAPEPSPDPLRFWLINTLYLAVVLLLQDLAARSIRDSLARARSESQERRLTEDELRRSEGRFRVLFESGPVGIAVADETLHFSMANGAFCAMVGYREEELLRMRFLDVTHPENAAADRRAVQELLGGESPFYRTEKRYLRKDGTTVWAMTTVNAIRDGSGRFQYLLAMVEDISARKRAEQEREHVISLLQATLESTADGILEIDASGKIANYNQRFARMWGIPGEILAARDDNQALDFVMSQLADPPSFLAQVRELYDDPERESFDELVFKDGRRFERFSRPQLVNGRAVGRVWSFRDVSESRRAEQALRESEYRYRALFEAASDAIFVMKGEIFFDCNSKTLEMFACRREQIIGVPPDRYSPPLQPDGRSSRERALERIRAAYDGRPQFFEWLHVRADGTPFTAEVSLTRIDAAGDVLLLAMVRDISARKRLEEQLLQAQKMEAVGILAGGVAHDFNNILSAIVGYASLLQLRLAADDPLAGHVERILAAAERAANLTSSLLAFSRKQEVALRPVDLNETVLGFHRIMERLIGEDIDLSLRLAGEPLVVDADPRQLEQVLMNLATNSRDAMPRGGRLEIATVAVDRQHEAGGVPPGRYAAFSVSDSGAGMSLEVRSRVFEPFFTTKEAGKGTGLGLAIVQGIVQKHGGHVELDSGPDRGTTVTVLLPRGGEAVPAVAGRRGEPIPRGRETILLVEDEAAVRQVTRSMLEEFGYTVLEADDGVSAQYVFRENRDRVDLVLCDLLMPRLNGRETLAGLREMRPGVPAVFISGYTADVIAQKGLADDAVSLLMKPLDPGTLLRTVRETLDR
jgi:PAS domain S-box-containing protein